MTLGDQVLEMEDDYERLKTDVRSMEEELNDLEQDLEVMTQQRNQLQEFKDWVALAYPVVVRDYESVKVIEEMANGI